MKILIVAPMLPHADGPGAVPMLLHAQLVGLSGRHEVGLVTSIGDEPWEPEAADVARTLVSGLYLADRRVPKTLRDRTRRRADLARRWSLSRVPWRNLWFAPPSLQASIDRALSESSFDVVAVEDSAMARVNLPPGLPAVLTDHEVTRARPEPSAVLGSPATRLKGRLLASDWQRAQRFQAEMWERYPLLQVFTQEDADEVVRLAPRMSGRVRVNPFGIAMPPPADVAQETEDTLLFLGNFTHPPNRDAAHWLVREIMPVVWRDRPAAHLLLVGSDPPEDVRALAAGQVDIFANVPDSAAYLERAAICLAPVRSGGGMRVKVLTALASGKAVVTTGRGAYGFIFNRQDPPMVIADDGPEIASGIVRVLGDAKLRRDLGRSGREIAERHHSPEAWAIRLEQVYAEAAAVRTPSSSGAPEL